MSGAVSIGVAAVAIGGAIASGGATFAVIAAVGATVAAVGAVTKVRELAIAGAAIGVVGAVGGLASAAGAFGAGGVFGTGGTIFGGAAEAGGAVGAAGSLDAVGSTGSAAAPATSGLGGIDAEIAQWSNYGTQAATDQGAWGGGVIGQVYGSSPEAVTAATSPAVEAAAPPVVAAAEGGTTPVTGATAPSAPGTPMIAQGTAPPTVTPGSAGGQVTGTVSPAATPPTSAGSATTPSGGAVAGSDSTWKEIFDFMKKNDRLLAGVIQAGSSFLSGATNPLTPSQIEAMNATAKANQAAARKYDAEAAIMEQQRANMGAPIPVASRVTGRPTGMMNWGSGVTGAVT